MKAKKLLALLMSLVLLLGALAVVRSRIRSCIRSRI